MAQATLEKIEALMNKKFDDFAVLVQGGFADSEKRFNLKIDGLKGEINDVKDEIVGIKDEIVGIKGEIVGIKDEIKYANQRIDEIQREMRSGFVSLGADVDKIRFDLEQIKTKLDQTDKRDSEDVSALFLELRKLKQRLNKIEAHNKEIKRT